MKFVYAATDTITEHEKNKIVLLNAPVFESDIVVSAFLTEVYKTKNEMGFSR